MPAAPLATTFSAAAAAERPCVQQAYTLAERLGVDPPRRVVELFDPQTLRRKAATAPTTAATAPARQPRQEKRA
jgi:hypothetical protein